MTRDQQKEIRRRGRIEAELRIIEAIPSHTFTGATAPNVLGRTLLNESIAIIREELNS